MLHRNMATLDSSIFEAVSNDCASHHSAGSRYFAAALQNTSVNGPGRPLSAPWKASVSLPS